MAIKLGYIPDSLAYMPFEEVVKTAAGLGFQGLEIPCGNWSQAPHMDLDGMLESAAKRDEYTGIVRDSGMEIFALNCSGNQLAPGELGAQNEEVVQKTFKLAGLLGVDKIVMMSGLPGGSPSDATPNWITTSWPPITQDILKYQWNDVLIPYWKSMNKLAEDCGVKKISLENHGFQLVYNAETFLRLNAEIGDLIGFNLDPGHLFWMGGDPIEAVRLLKDKISHVHAKDTRIERRMVEPHGVLDTKTIEEFSDRAWNYVALGYGHGEDWWSEFFSVLAMNGFDGVISLENEDLTMDALLGVEKSVDMLKRTLTFSL
jgi:sugar phosphate isomerase/epimerase